VPELRTSEVLNRSADLIELDGWFQNGYAPAQSVNGVSMDGLPVCAMGAIYRANGTPLAWSGDLGCWNGVIHDDPPAALALASHLGGPSVHIPRWNDALGQTQAEVIETLRAVALIEASREDARVEVSV
jgi:hypothetical protein